MRYGVHEAFSARGEGIKSGVNAKKSQPLWQVTAGTLSLSLGGKNMHIIIPETLWITLDSATSRTLGRQYPSPMLLPEPSVVRQRNLHTTTGI
jgi:hypothetical protein